MIMQEHHSESLTDLSTFFVHYWEDFYESFLLPHFLSAVLLTISYQKFVSILTNNDKATQTLYEVTFWNCVICNCFCDCIKQKLGLKFWKNLGSFEVNLKKNISHKRGVSSVVVNNVLCYLELSAFQHCSYIIVCLLVWCLKDLPEKRYQSSPN